MLFVWFLQMALNFLTTRLQLHIFNLLLQIQIPVQGVAENIFQPNNFLLRNPDQLLHLDLLHNPHQNNLNPDLNLSLDTLGLKYVSGCLTGIPIKDLLECPKTKNL